MSGKVVDQRRWVDALDAWQVVPAGLLRPVAFAVVCFECSIVALLLLAPSIGAAAAAVFLAFALSAGVVTLAHGHRPPCGCLSLTSSIRVGAFTQLRSALLTLIALSLLVSPRDLSINLPSLIAASSVVTTLVIAESAHAMRTRSPAEPVG